MQMRRSAGSISMHSTLGHCLRRSDSVVSVAVFTACATVDRPAGSLTLGWTDWRGVGIGQDDAGSCLFVNFDATHARE